ncbi:MAG: hypothetical protein JWM53_6279 [bacterium]|nr:hypothetical protein [bacterium]
MKRAWWLWLLLVVGGCAGVVDGPVTTESESLGDPENGFPSPYERALFMATNRTRSDPSTIKGAGSKIYPAAAPLALAYDLERSSRFHATMLSKGHAPLMHPSPCTLVAGVGTSGCDGTPSCGCQGGVTCNSCDATACTAGTDPGTRIKAFDSSANFGWGEIIAAGYGDAWSTMDAWVDEPAAADGHRQIVTSGSYGVVGFGHASDASACYRGFDGGDFAGDKPAVPLVASAAPKPIAGPAGTFRVYATWADKTGGAPTALRAVVDGACTDMTKELGDPKLNATYFADVPLANGCHNVYVLGTAASGAQAAYPTTTAFTINVGGAANCPDSVPQPVAACGSGGGGGGGGAADMSGPGDMATGGAPDLSTPPNDGPLVTLTAPADGARYALGSTVTVQATAGVASGHALQSVVANWTRFGYTSTYPLTFANGQWTLSLQVTQRAGTRTVSVTATDDAGKSTTTASVSINVQ